MTTNTLQTAYSQYNADDKWTLTIESAKAVLKAIKTVSEGSYEYRVVVQPIRQAVRAKQSEVNIYTQGFGTSSVAQILNNCGVKYKTH